MWKLSHSAFCAFWWVEVKRRDGSLPGIQPIPALIQSICTQNGCQYSLPEDGEITSGIDTATRYWGVLVWVLVLGLKKVVSSTPRNVHWGFLFCIGKMKEIEWRGTRLLWHNRPLTVLITQEISPTIGVGSNLACYWIVHPSGAPSRTRRWAKHGSQWNTTVNVRLVLWWWGGVSSKYSFPCQAGSNLVMPYKD